MFGHSEELLTLEQKLETLAKGGLSLTHPFTPQDLLETWTREELEEPGFTSVLIALGETEEEPPFRNHSVNVWHFDTESITGGDSYIQIAERLAELTQGSLVIENVRADDELENLDFKHAGKAVHIDLQNNDDWVDPGVFLQFVQLLALSDPSKVFLYYDMGTQDCIMACVTRNQFEALKKAGVGFKPLEASFSKNQSAAS